MRVVVVGLGVQGRKRFRVAGGDVVATVDPVQPDASHGALKDVPPEHYDGALLCIPDEAKPELLEHLLSRGKHVLVEKPILAEDEASIEALRALAKRSGATCYTAYNHRFEPHFVRMRETLQAGVLGRVYCARLFYGNGTARLVRESEWRDAGAGVLPDLGSHLLDTALFWFGAPGAVHLEAAHRFENRAFDHVRFSGAGAPALSFEMTLLSWRNHFTADVFGELGSAHIESLCKWGPTTFTLRRRILPSGRPEEESVTLVEPDPTWALEYAHWKDLCARGDEGNLANDLQINHQLQELSRAALGQGRA